MTADEPSPRTSSRAARNPISRRQIEIVIARSVATFSLIYVLLALRPVLEQSRGMLPTWNVIIIASVFGGLAASLIAAFVNRGVLAVNGYIAFAWFFAMVTWPLAIVNPSVVGKDPPWLFYLLTVATAAAAVAWPVWAAAAALVVLAATYGVVRATPAGGGGRIDLAALDTIYAILLGGAVLMLITLLRQAAASVDLAQAAAIDRYSYAVREHATEVERVQVDAIVHDSVLTTFLSAARAETPEAKRLAGRMAENAMGYLRGAASAMPGPDESVSATEVADRILADAAGVPAEFTIQRDAVSRGDLPPTAAEAVHSAAVQAMMNSAQHAGDAPGLRRWIIVRPGPEGGIEVEVGDTGRGFDPATVPQVRIGLRVSILERVANAGGRVAVDAAPGRGATVRISWPNSASMVARSRQALAAGREAPPR